MFLLPTMSAGNLTAKRQLPFGPSVVVAVVGSRSDSSSSCSSSSSSSSSSSNW